MSEGGGRSLSSFAVEAMVIVGSILRNFAAADLASYLRAHAEVVNAELLSFAVLRSRFEASPSVDPELLGTVTLRREQQFMNLLAAREAADRGIRIGLVEMLDQAARIVATLERP